MKKVVVHTFSIGDVEDPDIYAAEPIWNWEQTEAGKWVMKNSTDTYWVKHWSADTYNQQYKIVATLSDIDCTYFNLKWGFK